MANIITCIRIVISADLLFCPALSPVFYELYIAAGLTDMVDGTVARKTGTVSELGSRLDTIADILFTLVCLIKLLPVLDVPVWLYIWTAVIAMIKLFIFPLTLAYIDMKYSTAVVCVIATIAAVHEGYLIQAGRTT